MESRNRSNGRRTGADTELEPSEEFPILYGLLTAPKSYKPKSREQMRDWHKPLAIEADSSLDIEDDYDSSPNNSCNDDSPSPADENDMSLIFNYIGARGRDCEVVKVEVEEDEDDFDSDSGHDDNSPSSTTSFRKKTSDLARRQFPYGERPRRRTTGRAGSNQREKISSRRDMPLLEAMIMASPKVSTTSDFDIRKLSDVIGLDSSPPSRSPTRRIVNKSEPNSNSSPPNLVPSVNLNVNVKVQSSSQISNSDRSGLPLVATGSNEVINYSNSTLYTEQSNEELHLRTRRENIGEDLSVSRLSTNAKCRLEDFSQNHKHTNEMGLLGKPNGKISHFPITVPKKRPYHRRADDLHPHLAKALRLGSGFPDSVPVEFQEDERPYKCSECDLSFKTATLLSRHMHTHLRDQLFQCELCSSTFRRRDNLLAHMRTSCKGKKFLEAQQLERRTLLAQASIPIHVQNNFISNKTAAIGTNNFPIKMSLADFMNNTVKERHQSSSGALRSPIISNPSTPLISQLKEQIPKLPLELEIEEVIETDESTPTSSNSSGFPLKKLFNREYPPQLNRHHDFLKSISPSNSSQVERNNVPTMRKLLGSASLAIKRPTAVVQPAIYVRESKSVEVIDVNDEEEEEKPPPVSTGIEAFPCGHCNGVFRDMDRLIKHSKTHMKGKFVERIEVVIE